MQQLKTLLGKGFKLGTPGLLAAVLAVTALGLRAAPAVAATVVVNTTTDQDLGDCSVTCSLRDAVATANPGDTIAIPAGHYVLTLSGIFVGGGKDLTISGAGARTTVLDGNHMWRVVTFGDGTPAAISDVALVNGLAEGDPRSFDDSAGGAILGKSAPLKLERCLIANNQALAGGGVAWIGPATIDGCTFTGNQATGTSEAAAFGGGTLLIDGEHTFSNSTISGNAAPGGTGGGVAFSGSTFHLFNVTLTANQAAPGAGGGIADDGTGIPGSTLANTIIAGNSGGDCFFSGTPAGADHSLDSDGSCVSGPGNLPGVNPLLGPLANNGGPTDTNALLAGSPALNAGDNATCLATDQRGVMRQQFGACDIGAFEAPTPESLIAALIAQINALVTQGALAQNKANPLITKLTQAFIKLEAGQITAACGQLGAFINQLNADIGNGTLTPAQGQPLLDAANAIKTSMGC